MDVEIGGEQTGVEETSAVSAEDLAAVRELILLAHPDVVPELVTGSTVADLTASVEAARAAYAGVLGRQPSAVRSEPPVVPAGGATVVVDPANLPTAEKIRRGLANRTK